MTLLTSSRHGSCSWKFRRTVTAAPRNGADHEHRGCYSLHFRQVAGSTVYEEDPMDAVQEAKSGRPGMPMLFARMGRA